MAGEIFIARQDTLEEVKQTVNEIDTNVDTVNNTTSETKTQTTGIKADTDGLKLSTDSIKQIADTILERIGLTTDSGGGISAGSLFAKLNALLSAGGGISGFKYTLLEANGVTKKHLASSSGLFIYYYENSRGYGNVTVTSGKGAMLELVTGKTDETPYFTGIAFFTSGATITAYSKLKGFYVKVDVFEFI